MRHLRRLNLHYLVFMGLLPASLSSMAHADSSVVAGSSAAADASSSASASANSDPVDPNTPEQVLSTIHVTAQADGEDPTEISAVRKTIITQAEMINYGDISVVDALRRAAGIQMGKGGASRASFRGLSIPPIIQINGETVQGGKRIATSIVDTLTVDMIDRIEVTRQASVTQASGAVGGVINIILKDGQSATSPISGVVKGAVGQYGSQNLNNDKRQLNLQLDGKVDALSYSTSAVYNRNSADAPTTLINATPTGTSTSLQHTTSDSSFDLFGNRLTYKLNDITKVFSDFMYSQQANTSITDNAQSLIDGDNTRLALRLERTPGPDKETFRISGQWQKESENDMTPTTDRQVNDGRQTFAAGYDGIIKDFANQEIKYGFQNSWATIDSSQVATIQENSYALYGEENVRLTDHQTITAGVRQEWLERSGLVDYDHQALNPALFYRYQFDKAWSLQAGYTQNSQNPQPQQLSPVVTQATGAGAGTLSNPDTTGNANLRSQQIHSAESTLTFNTPDGGFNLTGFYRDINDYILNAVEVESNGRYAQLPENAGDAIASGVELDGRWNIQLDRAQKLLISGQISTVHVLLQDANEDQHAPGVAPYTASVGVSYQYKPWRWLTNINLGYTPSYVSPVQGQPYVTRLSAKTSLDISTTKRFNQGWAITLALRNVLGESQYTELDNTDGDFYQSRQVSTAPSVLLTVEKRF